MKHLIVPLGLLIFLLSPLAVFAQSYGIIRGKITAETTNSASACNYDPDAEFDHNTCFFIGDPCDDEDSDTYDDIIQETCGCAGTPYTLVDELAALSVRVYPNPHQTVVWSCTRDPSHEWLRSVCSRVSRNAGCPYCMLTLQSRQELTITFELLQFFKDIDPRGFKTKVNGRLKSIDIFIPQLCLGIEFVGSYWHKDKRALDKLKTEQLKEKGFEIIRVREEPLRKITDVDIVSSKPFNGKQGSGQ